MPDWAAIKSEYITTSISQRALSAKRGVSFSTLQKRCKREDWTGRRREFHDKVEAAALESSATDAAEQLAVVRDGAQRLAEIAAERLETAKTTMDLRNLAAVLSQTGAMLRDFYDLPTPGEAEARRIAAERLEMEKGRYDGSEGAVVKVVIGEEADEWAK